MASFVRTLQTQYLESGGPLGGDELDWDRSRGGDFRCITQALYLISKYPRQMTVGSIVQLEKWLLNPTARPIRKKKGKAKGKTSDEGDEEEDDLSQDSSFLAKIHSTLQTFSELVAEDALRPLFLKDEWRVSPVEFVMMCLLISIEKDKLSLQDIAEKIGEMRVVTRAEHVDIRTNARVAKTMFDFISRVAETRSNGGTKRKRGVTDDEESKRKKSKDQRIGDAATIGAPTSQRVPPPPRATLPPPTPEIATMDTSLAPPRTPVKSKFAPASATPIIPPPRPTPQDRLQTVRDAKHATSSSSPAAPLQASQ